MNGVREIERWTRHDGGGTWASEAVTSGSKFDNIRPSRRARCRSGRPVAALAQLHGRYVHYTDYLTSVKMDRPGKVTRKEPPALPALSAAIEPKAVLTAMERVGDWQLENPSKHETTDWTQGAGYTGIMALRRDFRATANTATPWWQWVKPTAGNPAPAIYHADDHVRRPDLCRAVFPIPRSEDDRAHCGLV